MRSALPAELAFVGGTASLSSLTPAGLLFGLALVALGSVLAVAALSARLTD